MHTRSSYKIIRLILLQKGHTRPKDERSTTEQREALLNVRTLTYQSGRDLRLYKNIFFVSRRNDKCSKTAMNSRDVTIQKQCTNTYAKISLNHLHRKIYKTVPKIRTMEQYLCKHVVASRCPLLEIWLVDISSQSKMHHINEEICVLNTQW